MLTPNAQNSTYLISTFSHSEQGSVKHLDPIFVESKEEFKRTEVKQRVSKINALHLSNNKNSLKDGIQ